jgi:hypothetical protein
VSDAWAGAIDDQSSGYLNLEGLPGALVEAGTRTRESLDELPDQIGGLGVEIKSFRDTCLVGEPVLLEIRLRNRGKDAVLDPCLLNPVYGYVEIYALHTDSTAVCLAPRATGMLVAADYLRLDPGVAVGSAVVVGARGVIWGGQTRGSTEVPHPYFARPGEYEVFAVYKRLPEDYFEERQSPLGEIVSKSSGFVVIESEAGEEKAGEEIGGLLSDRKRWEALGELHLKYPDSAYAPYALAKYVIGLTKEKFHLCAADIQIDSELERLTRAYPDHRVSQETEFDLATLLGAYGNTREANARLDALLEKYPYNVRAYEIFRPDGGLVLREDHIVRASGGE